jgi:hypothetical protein
LWIHSVPQEIVNSVSDTERRRQEAINEVIYTERDFVRDMEYLRDVRLLGIVAGYPGVFQGNPHPYPWKPAPAARVRVFTDTGCGIWDPRSGC